MTPDLDLMLATLERALETAILPGGGNAAAREEASLAILFSRWIRAVVDDVPAAERASLGDARAALEEIGARLRAAGASGTATALAEEIGGVAEVSVSTAGVRAEVRRAKALLARVLRELRASGEAELANAVRARLFDLALREIERERAYGRPTGLDPDSRSLPSLADLVREQERNHR